VTVEGSEDRPSPSGRINFFAAPRHREFPCRLSDVKTLVSQLYESLHVKEHQIQKEVELSTQLETLQQELLPMEQVRESGVNGVLSHATRRVANCARHCRRV
jgi:hypothetical protein